MPLECDMPLKSEAVTEKGSHSLEPLWRNAWFKKRFSSFNITMRNFFLAQANKLRPSARVPLARPTLVRHQGRSKTQCFTYCALYYGTISRLAIANYTYDNIL